MGKKSLTQVLNFAESLSGLQGSLLSAANGKPVQSLLVTSGRDHEGKSTVAIGLATALARQTRRKVLLVDANFRRPSLAGTFEVAAAPGFCEVVRGAKKEEVIQETSEPNLLLLPTGEEEFVSELLAALPSQIEAICDGYDFVVFDGDSTLTSSEAALISQHVDGVILVAECEKTKWEILSLCREKIDRLGGKILGVVMNKRQFYIPGALYEKV